MTNNEMTLTDTQAVDIIAADGTSYSSQQLLVRYGVVVIAGQNVYLTQDPYLTNRLEDPIYAATGVDVEGYYYRIAWSILSGGYDGCMYRGDTVNWDRPRSVTAL